MSTVIRILVADPSATGGEQTANQFRGRPDVEVQQVQDGPAAVAALREGAIDLAIIDLKLPGLDGQAVRAWASEGGRRLLLLTADRLNDRWTRVSTQVRAYDTLLKPVRRPRADTVLGAYQRLCQPTRALVVDGMIASLHAVAKLLRESRFKATVEGVDAGLHAIRIAELDHFDVALISLQQEDLPGLEVAARIAQGHQAPPIILMGGPGDQATMSETALEAFGAQAYLRKPFAAHELENALHTVFGLWRPYLAKALSTAAPITSS